MEIAYFDCQFGAAGDMLLGALLDAGLNEKDWLSEVAKIALPASSYQIKIRQVKRRTLAAKKLDVVINQDSLRNSEHCLVMTPQTTVHCSNHPNEISYGHEEQNHHRAGAHDHHKVHFHDEHVHDHNDDNSHDHGGAAVALAEVQAVIDNSDISEKVKSLAHRIVLRLGNCEGLVHGMDSEAVYFHEIGAVDSIIDIVGFAIAYDMLGIEKSYVSSVPVGHGHVHTAHGIFPVPAPAVALLLAQIKAPISDYQIDFECLTPTGAAILAEICQKWGVMPGFDELLSVGYGAGTIDSRTHPNVCRVMLGRVAN
jgi:hypothetical protein